MLRLILKQIKLIFANRALAWVLSRIPFGIVLGYMGILFVFVLARVDARNCNGTNGGDLCGHLQQQLYKIEGFNHAIYEREAELPAGLDCDSTAMGEYKKEVSDYYRDEIKKKMVFKSIKWHIKLDQMYKVALRHLKLAVTAEQKSPLPFKLEERFVIQFADEFEIACKNFDSAAKQVNFFSHIENSIVIVDIFQGVVWDELNGVPLEPDVVEEVDSKPEEKYWPLVEVIRYGPLNVRSDPSVNPENRLENQIGGFPQGAQACQVEVYEEDPQWVQVKEIESNNSLAMHSGSEDKERWVYRGPKGERRVEEVGVCVEIDDIYYESRE